MKRLFISFSSKIALWSYKCKKIEYSSTKVSMLFEFISEGSKGKVHKVILYTKGNHNFYTLGLGDKNIETGQINEYAITNNGDSKKILATIASTFYTFTEKYPDAWIHLSGVTDTRTRFVRIAISNNLIKIKRDFDVYGLVDNEWQEFRKGIEYSAFVMIRTNNK